MKYFKKVHFIKFFVYIYICVCVRIAVERVEILLSDLGQKINRLLIFSLIGLPIFSKSNILGLLPAMS